MALETYDDLVSDVKLFSGGSSAFEFDEIVKRSIDAAESEMNHGFVDQNGVAQSGLRVPDMVIRDDLTVNKAYESLPGDFLELISVAWIDNDRERPMEQVPADGIGDVAYYARRYGYQPYRRYYSIHQGTQIRIAPEPTLEGPITVRIVGYGKVPPLADPDPCYTILRAYPNIYRYGALRHVAMWQRDTEAVAQWTQTFVGSVKGANKAALNR